MSASTDQLLFNSFCLGGINESPRINGFIGLEEVDMVLYGYSVYMGLFDKEQNLLLNRVQYN